MPPCLAERLVESFRRVRPTTFRKLTNTCTDAFAVNADAREPERFNLNSLSSVEFDFEEVPPKDNFDDGLSAKTENCLSYSNEERAVEIVLIHMERIADAYREEKRRCLEVLAMEKDHEAEELEKEHER
jgi:hypothetical protein